MGWICTDGNRYIGEHDCKLYHFGDMTIVRPCCVKAAIDAAKLTMRNAITTSHPAHQMYRAAWNSLNEAELKLVPDLVPVYDHGPAGFDNRSTGHANPYWYNGYMG